jgi:hypothetical protein
MRDERGYVCQGCGARFDTSQELLRHNQEMHGGGSTGGNTDDLPTVPEPAGD